MSFSIWRVFASNAPTKKMQKQNSSRFSNCDNWKDACTTIINCKRMEKPVHVNNNTNPNNAQLQAVELWREEKKDIDLDVDITDDDDDIDCKNDESMHSDQSDNMDIVYQNTGVVTEFKHDIDVDADTTHDKVVMINSKNHSHLKPIKDHRTHIDALEKETNSAIKIYSKRSLAVIYVLICCDFYTRSFPFIFGSFIIRIATIIIFYFFTLE